MRMFSKVAVVAAAALAIGCGDQFLTGPKLTESPNTPTVASAAQRLVAVQASLFTLSQGQLARQAAMLTQHLSGTNNQQQQHGSQYLITENDVGGYMTGFYTGGGLVDLRAVMKAAQAAGDKQLEGVAKVWEAYAMGTVTSLWGDVPYSEAVNPEIKTPKLDTQQSVYNRVQLVLDTAIVLLGGTGPGPGTADFVYGGNTARWIRAAYSLKARFHMHTAARLGNTAYTAALAAATLGINEAPTSVTQAMHGQAVGDLRAFHDAATSSANIWAQFLGNRADMTSNQQFITMLQTRNDPRLQAYFDAVGGSYKGADQFGRNAATAATVNVSVRRQNTFRQPFLTWVETQLIIAEANQRLGNAAAAATAYNAVRTALGLSTNAAPTLNDILEEKYIALFQTIEVYSEWRRTCYPKLTPAGTNFTPVANVPMRLPYAFGERQTNPNIPAPTAAPALNWANPAACPVT